MTNFSLNHLHHFLLLLFFFLLTQTLVQADEALIDQTCRDTEIPALCVHCIKSDPGGEKADTAADLASIIIDCTSNHAGVLIKNTTDLAAAHSSDKQFVTVCQHCRNGYSQAKKNLATATAKLKKGDYDDANHYVTFALNNENVRSCEPNLYNYELTIVPKGVFYQIRVYEELSGVAMAIIDRLNHQDNV